MATFEPQAIDGPTPDPEPNLATTAVLNANIETLRASKNTVEITPAKVAFESTIAILTLVRVRVPVPFPSSTHLSVRRLERDDKRRCARGISQILCQNVPRVEGCDPGVECG